MDGLPQAWSAWGEPGEVGREAEDRGMDAPPTNTEGHLRLCHPDDQPRKASKLQSGRRRIRCRLYQVGTELGAGQ